MSTAKSNMRKVADQSFCMTEAAGITDDQALLVFNKEVQDAYVAHQTTEQDVSSLAVEDATVTNLGKVSGDTVKLTDGTVGTLL